MRHFSFDDLWLIAMGGCGMYLVLSFQGLPSDYWNVIAGAWAYGLIGGWLCYGDDVLKYFSKTND
jgi:hypothetical protein